MAKTEIENEKIPQLTLALLVEELKTPLVQVARSLEWAQLSGDASELVAARTSANSALQLVENYALGLKLANLGSELLALEPVAVTAVMYEVASELAPLAEVCGVTIELEIYGQYLPVLAHRQALAAALVSAGRSLIEALPAASEASNQLTLKLSVHRGRQGIIAGWYWQADKISADALKRGRQLFAASRQPLTSVSHGPASGVYVADMLLAAMNCQLKASKFHQWSGLAATLKSSHQLALI